MAQVRVICGTSSGGSHGETKTVRDESRTHTQEVGALITLELLALYALLDVVATTWAVIAWRR